MFRMSDWIKAILPFTLLGLIIAIAIWYAAQESL